MEILKNNDEKKDAFPWLSDLISCLEDLNASDLDISADL